MTKIHICSKNSDLFLLFSKYFWILLQSVTREGDKYCLSIVISTLAMATKSKYLSNALASVFKFGGSMNKHWKKIIFDLRSLWRLPQPLLFFWGHSIEAENESWIWGPKLLSVDVGQYRRHISKFQPIWPIGRSWAAIVSANPAQFPPEPGKISY